MSRTLIVGAGVVGLMCAYELNRRGEGVTIVDRGAPGAGCSSGNAGWIVPTHCEPVPGPGGARMSLGSLFRPSSSLYLRPTLRIGSWRWIWDFWRHCNERDHRAGREALAKLAGDTMGFYDSLVADGVEFEMARSGVLWVFLDRARMDDTLQQSFLMPNGSEHPVTLSRDALREMEPGLSGEVAGGILMKQERHLRPETLIAGLVARLHGMGVEVRAGHEVIGLRQDRRHITAVLTQHGEMVADNFLIAGGVWSGILVNQVGVHLPMFAARGYSITIHNPVTKPRRPLYLAEAKIACSPFHDALRIAGTVELTGINSVADPRRLVAMRQATNQYLNGWPHGDTEQMWMGMRPLTPDGLPVIGRVPGFENLYVATGHAKLGITLAPGTAVAVADLVCKGRTEIDLTPFDPARFHGSLGIGHRVPH